MPASPLEPWNQMALHIIMVGEKITWKKLKNNEKKESALQYQSE